MFEGEHYTRTTVRSFRMVGNAGPVAPSVVKDCLTSGTHRRRPVVMADWAGKLDAFLSFNERDVLTPAGQLRMDVAHKLAAEALAADADDIAQLEEMENAAKKGGKKGGEDA